MDINDSAFQAANRMISVYLQSVSLEFGMRLRWLEGVASLKLHAGCCNKRMLSGRTKQLRPVLLLIRCLHQTLYSLYRDCGHPAQRGCCSIFIGSVCHLGSYRRDVRLLATSALPSDVSSPPICCDAHSGMLLPVHLRVSCRVRVLLLL